jgi:hypothetical protein
MLRTFPNHPLRPPNLPGHHLFVAGCRCRPSRQLRRACLTCRPTRLHATKAQLAQVCQPSTQCRCHVSRQDRKKFQSGQPCWRRACGRRIQQDQCLLLDHHGSWPSGPDWATSAYHLGEDDGLLIDHHCRSWLSSLSRRVGRRACTSPGPTPSCFGTPSTSAAPPTA